MRRTARPAALLLATLAAGCGEKSRAPTELAAPAAASLARASSRVPYTLTFTGDVQSGPIANVALDPTITLANVAHAGTTLMLPELPELAGCGLAGGSWSPYAGSWTGQLAMSEKSGTTTLHLVSRDSDGYPVWITLQDDAVLTKNGSVSTLTFTDARAMVKKDRYPLVIIQPCASFTITAARQ